MSTTPHHHTQAGADEGPALLTTDQAAARLGISRRTIQELVYQKQLPVIRFGGRNVRFHPADLTRFIERHRHHAAGWKGA